MRSTGIQWLCDGCAQKLFEPETSAMSPPGGWITLTKVAAQASAGYAHEVQTKHLCSICTESLVNHLALSFR